MGLRRRHDRKRSGGQILAEYVIMLAVCAIFTVMFFVLLAAFTEYGARLIGLVSWEPNPPDRSQMEHIVSGTL